MDEMVMEIDRLALMLAGFLLCGYLLPWIRQKVGATKTEQLEFQSTHPSRGATRIFGVADPAI